MYFCWFGRWTRPHAVLPRWRSTWPLPWDLPRWIHRTHRQHQNSFLMFVVHVEDPQLCSFGSWWADLRKLSTLKLILYADLSKVILSIYIFSHTATTCEKRRSYPIVGLRAPSFVESPQVHVQEDPHWQLRDQHHEAGSFRPPAQRGAVQRVGCSEQLRGSHCPKGHADQGKRYWPYLGALVVGSRGDHSTIRGNPEEGAGAFLGGTPIGT